MPNIVSVNFKVKVTNPNMPVKQGGLKKGAVLDVFLIYQDSYPGGDIFLYWVWNEKIGRNLWESANQFKVLSQSNE